MNQCSDCLFYRNLPPPSGQKVPPGQGTCRRYPPATSVLPMPVQDSLGRQGFAPQTVSAFPVIQAENWCGEFHAKPMVVLS